MKQVAFIAIAVLCAIAALGLFWSTVTVMTSRIG
jgi:hypothetical protein